MKKVSKNRLSKEELLNRNNSFKGKKTIKFNYSYKFTFMNIEFILKVDKNSQICDVNPRIGRIYDRLHNRPILLDIYKDVIEDEYLRVNNLV